MNYTVQYQKIKSRSVSFVRPLHVMKSVDTIHAYVACILITSQLRLVLVFNLLQSCLNICNAWSILEFSCLFLILNVYSCKNKNNSTTAIMSTITIMMLNNNNNNNAITIIIIIYLYVFVYFYPLFPSFLFLSGYYYYFYY